MLKPRPIITAWQTPGLILCLLGQLREQRHFLRRHLGPPLARARQSADGSLEEADFRKITHYYGLAVPAILGEALCALRGAPMTARERLASTCQGAMTGLGDDFLDKKSLSAEALELLLAKPGSSAGEQLAQYLFQTAQANVPDPVHSLAQLNRVMAAQRESQKQTDPHLGEPAIAAITWEKGGASVLYYRTAFAHPLADNEAALLAKLGGLMQLGNDLFDVFEDTQNGVNTLITSNKKVIDIRHLLLIELELAYEMAFLTNYPPASIRRFFALLSLGIFSRCLVCVDQWERSAQTTNGVFLPHLYRRKALICDMEKPANLWRSVYHHVYSCYQTPG